MSLYGVMFVELEGHFLCFLYQFLFINSVLFNSLNIELHNNLCSS